MDHLTLLRDKCYLCLSDATLLSSIQTGSLRCQMNSAFNAQLLDDPRLPQQMCEDCIDALQKSFKISDKLIKASLIYKQLLMQEDVRKNGNVILIDDDENANMEENMISKVKTNEVACQTETRDLIHAEVQADDYWPHQIDPMDFIVVVDNEMNDCPICGKTLRSFQGVCIHLKTHYKARPISCHNCNLAVSKMSDMALHLMNSACCRENSSNLE